MELSYHRDSYSKRAAMLLRNNKFSQPNRYPELPHAGVLRLDRGQSKFTNRTIWRVMQEQPQRLPYLSGHTPVTANAFERYLTKHFPIIIARHFAKRANKLSHWVSDIDNYGAIDDIRSHVLKLLAGLKYTDDCDGLQITICEVLIHYGMDSAVLELGLARTPTLQGEWSRFIQAHNAYVTHGMSVQYFFTSQELVFSRKGVATQKLKIPNDYNHLVLLIRKGGGQFAVDNFRAGDVFPLEECPSQIVGTLPVSYLVPPHAGPLSPRFPSTWARPLEVRA